MSDASPTKPKGKKAAKAGRNKAYCAEYKLSNSAKFNKAKRIAAHLRNANGNDIPSVAALTAICKSDTKSAKAFLPLRTPVTPSYIKHMAYNHKRYAKALRQRAKAEANGNDAARMKPA